MSERVHIVEQEPGAALITAGLSGWLKSEVDNSVNGRNHYLDDFDTFQGDLQLPYRDPSNTNAQKNRSHNNRLIEWTGQFGQFYDALDPKQQDFIVARQIFCAQMYLSGLFRVQCLMQASDQDDYYDRRLHGSAIGIDLEDVITQKLSNSSAPTIDELAKKTLGANQDQESYTKRLHEVGYIDAGQKESPTVERILTMQKDWVELIVDYALFAASERDDDLGRVPFLEPKSISDDPQVYYPFTSAA